MVKAPINVAGFIKQQLAISEKTQKDIALEVGFKQPNNISMIKDGVSKLPINRVPAFAKALNVDTVHLLRIVMREYMPETWAVIEGVLSQALVTDNEKALLRLVRKASRNMDIDYTHPKIAATIERVVESYADAEMEDRKSAVRAVESMPTRKRSK